MLRSLQSAAAVALLCLVAGACSNESVEGDVKCTDGVCAPKAVFAQGKIEMILVTPATVYAANGSHCGVYSAQKPIEETARVLATDACGVASLARTDWGIFWSTSTGKNIADKDTKGVLSWVADGQTTPTVVDATLSRPGGIAAIGDTVFVAVADGIRMLSRGSSQLERAVDATNPQALRAFEGALYWHDGVGTIYSWRSGDAKPSMVVERATVFTSFGDVSRQHPFAVGPSGIYWIGDGLFGSGALSHVPLAGGKAETIVEPKGFVKSIAVDDQAVYWAEGDGPGGLLNKKTTIHRLSTTGDTSTRTDVVVADLEAEVEALQSTPEGLYIASSRVIFPSDKDKASGLTAYGGPLLMLPRGVLDNRP